MDSSFDFNVATFTKQNRVLTPTGLRRSVWPSWKTCAKPTYNGSTPMLNLDFKELLTSFNDKKIDYLVVGGYALAIHGYLRESIY